MTLLDADKKLADPQNPNAVGEDTWELFEAMEESFGVNLGDFDSLGGISISELAANICKRADYPAKEKCLSAVAFYKLRRSFTYLFGIPVRTIRPTTPLRQLLPWRSRKARWHAMQEHLGFRLPQLTFPGWLLPLCLAVPTGIVIAAKVSFGINWALVIACWLTVDACAIYACIPFARSLPYGIETIGDLAKIALAQNYAGLAKSETGSSEEDVLASLRLLVSFLIGLELSKVLPETRIPADLNIY